MSNPDKQITISKDELLKILEQANESVNDIILDVDESTKKCRIISGKLYHNSDYQRFKRYIMKKYGYEVEQIFK